MKGNCCEEKTVGEVDYILTGWNEAEAKAAGCTSGCIYQAKGEDGSNRPKPMKKLRLALTRPRPGVT